MSNKYPVVTQMSAKGEADPPSGSPQDMDDIVCVVRHVLSDCSNQDALAAALRLYERLGLRG